MKKKTKMSDLDRKIWAVIIHDKALKLNMTYPQAVMFREKMFKQYKNELVIVSDDAAERMQKK